ncbi:CoA transferase [Sulfodiicoccus acidiphilus]|uniref:CoA transferase n=1 Tax=Sulfodiicoccus acidiphilus TaxID=1670455 RepID=A0A348B608_9CREN|nr:CaiB/BaiF CoA-transferase family protein [Sulfodiicoccus acidiphilus]BBD73610.1 CoA transferase [Sulfodiicoccus acidiphilus]GGU04758.1 CoA transferase [Sulfodiicoccus acidiphilus]
MTPLEGVRVVENGLHLAGPYCGRLLAELGAEVIKVEPPSGESNRRTAPALGEDSLLFHYYNAGKKSVVIDLKANEGKELMYSLIRVSDVFVTNYRPSALRRLGLDYEKLKSVNQKLIYTSISGYGTQGELGDLPGYDPLAQAETGLMIANSPDGAPKVNAMSLDYAAASIAALATVAALLRREKTGEGEFIDIALYDVGVMYVFPWIAFEISGLLRNVRGSRLMVFAPYNVYKTADGYVMIAIGEDEQWKRFIKLIGRDDLMNDPRLNTVRERVRNYDLVDDVVGSWAIQIPSREVVRIVLEAGGAAAEVKRPISVLNDRFATKRNMVWKADTPVGQIPIPGSAIKLGRDSPPPLGRAPTLGEHTAEVLAGLGLSRDEISLLEKRGVISLGKGSIK